MRLELLLVKYNNNNHKSWIELFIYPIIDVDKYDKQS